MRPTPEPAEGTDWAAILEAVLAVVSLGVVVWTMWPGLRLGTTVAITRFRDGQRARRDWEHIQNQMAWETYIVRESLEGAADGLAARLGVD